MDTQVTCPHCRNEFPIDQIMSAQMAEKIRGELEAEYVKKVQQVAADREKLAVERKALEASEEQFDQRLRESIAKEREKIQQHARAQAQEVVAVELKDREDQLAEAKKRMRVYQETEMHLLKEKRRLEELAEQNELEVARRMDEERQKVRAAAMAQAHEQYQLKQAEKDHIIEGLKKRIDELQLNAEQGSQQIQGEVQEIALENMLASEFPCDVIKPIAKGAHGADALQHVFDSNGRECGTILWESKRTKTWQDRWLSKVIDDQQEAKATIACIVSGAMPESIRHFEEVNGVWVASWSCARSVAIALRRVIIEAALARQATEGQHGKMELVYNYIYSAEFRNRVRGFMEPFIEMQDDLNAEKRALNRQWNKRQKQLDRALASSAGLFGDFQGILGNDLQEIEGMDLLALEASE